MTDIILITVDSLRADHLGCYGYHRDTSPTIDRLASGGVLFSQAISSAGRTPDAFPSMLASVLPTIGKPGTIPRSARTLAQQLKEDGYHTAAFHSNPYLTRYYGYDRGFDTFSDSLDEYSFWKGRLWMRAATKPQRNHKSNKLIAFMFKLVARILMPFSFHIVRRPIVTAEKITQQGLDWLNGQHGKGFLWLHYMDVHHPYLPLPQYLSQFRQEPIGRRRTAGLYRRMLKEPRKLSPDDITALVDLYDADIKYVDDNIKRLLDGLGSRLEDALVIVTADHGDEFGEHGRFSHQSLYEGIIRVPWIMAGPGIKSGAVVEQQVNLLDLLPTINSLVGVYNPPAFKGKSRLPAINGQPGDSDGIVGVYNRADLGRSLISFRTPHWKYIRTERMKGSAAALSEETYNLKNDPGEKHNLHAIGNKEAEAFEKQARAAIAAHLKKQGGRDIDAEKERIRARLRQIAGK